MTRILSGEELDMLLAKDLLRVSQQAKAWEPLDMVRAQVVDESAAELVPQKDLLATGNQVAVNHATQRVRGNAEE